jgi:hypothetical protein
MPVEASSSRKLAQPFVEQKIRPLAADWVRRRIRRMDPARAEVEWVMVRESMGSWFFPGVARTVSVRRQPAGLRLDAFSGAHRGGAVVEVSGASREQRFRML